jgi:hypothetical protein
MADEDETPDAATPEGVEKQKLTAKNRALRKKLALKGWLATPEGRALFYEIVFTLCGVNDPLTNVANDRDYTLIREGARQVGLDLQNRALQADREQYMVLLTENLPKP